GREGNDPGGAVTVSDETRQVGVHGPGHVRIAGGTEFPGSHEDHVGNIRKSTQRFRVEQVANDRLDSTLCKFRWQVGIGKTRYGDDSLRNACPVAGTSG